MDFSPNARHIDNGLRQSAVFAGDLFPQLTIMRMPGRVSHGLSFLRLHKIFPPIHCPMEALPSGRRNNVRYFDGGLRALGDSASSHTGGARNGWTSASIMYRAGLRLGVARLIIPGLA